MANMRKGQGNQKISNDFNASGQNPQTNVEVDSFQTNDIYQTTNLNMNSNINLGGTMNPNQFQPQANFEVQQTPVMNQGVGAGQGGDISTDAYSNTAMSGSQGFQGGDPGTFQNSPMQGNMAGTMGNMDQNLYPSGNEVIDNGLNKMGKRKPSPSSVSALSKPADTNNKAQKKTKKKEKVDGESLWEKLNRPIGKSAKNKTKTEETNQKPKKKEKVSKKPSEKRKEQPTKNNGMKTQNDQSEMSRREIRRRRRIRNQTIAYSVLIVVFGVCIFFGLWGVKQLMGGFENKSYNINQGIEIPETGETLETVPIETISEETETVSPENEYVRDELDDVVDAYLADMSLEQKIAQMFVVTPEALTGIPGPANVAGAKTETALQEMAIGGVMFQSKNFNTKEGAKEMVTKTVALAQRPLFTVACEDGGKTGTLSSVSELEVDTTLGFAEIGATADPAQAYSAGNTIGNYLAEYGFSLDLSPVADMASDEATSGLAGRTFGTDAEVVSQMVSSYVSGVQDAGVSACLTHFPGHGETTGDSKSGVAYTERTLADMQSYEFLPFQAGIDAGADFVMVGHISAPNVTGDSTPASLSPMFVTDILRNQMGFSGVVISERMDVASITDYYSTEEAVLMAVNAGVDIILCPQDHKAAITALTSAVADGTISEDRINQSLHRIYRVKLSGATE